MSDSDSEESQGSCACSCDARCVRSPTPTSSRRGAESTSGCPSSDFLPSDPISGHASPSADFRIADSGVVVGRPWRRPQPPATPDMKASRDVSVKQKRSRMPPGAVELGVKSPRAARPPRFPAATSSGCPSPSRSERSGWWDQQQLSPVSCASGYWDDEQPLRDWDDDDPRHGRDDAHRVSPESEGSGESERLKALFTACDTDGDGYITSANLAGLLSMLGLEGSGETLARELGADRRGRVSLHAFLARRKQLAQEVNAIRSEGGEKWVPELWSGGSEGGDCDPLSPPRPSSPFSRQQQGGRARRQDHHLPAAGRRQQLPYTSRQVLEATNKKILPPADY